MTTSFVPQPMMYLTFGLVGLTFDYALFLALHSLQVSVAISSGLGYLTGTVVTFALNARFNFKTIDSLLVRAGRYFFVAIGSAMVSSLVISSVASLVATPEAVLKIVVTTPFLVTQFWVNRVWTFRQRI